MIQTEGLPQALADLHEETAKALIKAEVQAGVPVTKILDEIQSGLAEVGSRYEKNEYFITELMYAAQIMKEIMIDLEPLLAGAPSLPKKGKVVIGTVAGDVHDIGKDVVVSMLRGAGFEVIDLGVDVDPERFVEAVRNSGANIVGMSVFLTMSFDAAAATVRAFEKAGLRDKVSIMIGGGPVTERVAKGTGCDFYGRDAPEAVKYAEKIVAQG
jgi:methylmalonyl-CoA mutase cobalamin-binding domain/chain